MNNDIRVLSVAALVFSSVAVAHEEPFGYSRGAQSEAMGEWELTQWSTARVGKESGRYTALDLSTELEYGVTAVAVPIKNEDGRVVAAINCTAIRNEEAEAVLAARLPPLRSAAAEISAALTRFPALAHAILR
jgi:hypothetical protein